MKTNNNLKNNRRLPDVVNEIAESLGAQDYENAIKLMKKYPETAKIPSHMLGDDYPLICQAALNPHLAGDFIKTYIELGGDINLKTKSLWDTNPPNNALSLSIKRLHSIDLQSLEQAHENIRLLIDQGCNMKVATESDNSAFMTSCCYLLPSDVFNKLVDSGANINGLDIDNNLMITSFVNKKVLRAKDSASMDQHLDKLIEKGIDFNIPDIKCWQLPLQVTLNADIFDWTEKLANHGCPTDDLGFYLRKANGLEWLLNRDENAVHAINEDGVTLLEHHVKRLESIRSLVVEQAQDCVKLIISRGAELTPEIEARLKVINNPDVNQFIKAYQAKNKAIEILNDFFPGEFGHQKL